MSRLGHVLDPRPAPITYQDEPERKRTDVLPTTSRSTYKPSMDQAPPAVPSPKAKWWKRNWKWFVPLGCLSITIFFVGFVASIILIMFSAFKSTDVYKDALARAKANPAVIEALGSPIKEGFLVSGNTNVNGAAGEANLAIPISGPKGKGTIYVAATKSLGHWNDSGLVVEIRQTHQRIDLLHGSTVTNPP